MQVPQVSKQSELLAAEEFLFNNKKKIIRAGGFTNNPQSDDISASLSSVTHHVKSTSIMVNHQQPRPNYMNCLLQTVTCDGQTVASAFFLRSHSTAKPHVSSMAVSNLSYSLSQLSQGGMSIRLKLQKHKGRHQGSCSKNRQPQTVIKNGTH